jgi:hypothetical protein
MAAGVPASCGSYAAHAPSFGLVHRDSSKASGIGSSRSEPRAKLHLRVAEPSVALGRRGRPEDSIEQKTAEPECAERVHFH